MTDLPPVRDWAGHIVWRLVVSAGELTCLDCGETIPAGARYCWRCVDDEGKPDAKRNPRLVLTESYLKTDEYERSG